jgi:ribosomal protein L7Ae-like RNA K-turn-binding protein
LKQNKVESLLGLCTRSRNLVSGEFATEGAVKDGSAWLVLVATDASANTKKLFKDKCSFYEVPCFEYGTKESLGHAIGKEIRASIAVLDEGFAKSIMKHLESLNE